MRSISIHIGINQVDPQEYRGWRGELVACEADAKAMAALAAAQGITARSLLLTADATYARVKAELTTAAAALQRNDYLLLTFAGHGASIPRVDLPASTVDTPAHVAGAASPAASEGHDPDELDGCDEAWCLHDTLIGDNELHDCFCQLAAGVRVCVVSDSCFCGTVTRTGELAERHADTPRRGEQPDRRERRMAPRLASALYRRDFLTRYQARKRAVAASHNRQPGAHIALLAGCQDNQTALEGDRHGCFTEQLLRTWDGGRYTGSHGQLIDQIKVAMPRRQQPTLFVSGAHDTEFLNSRPFTPGH